MKIVPDTRIKRRRRYHLPAPIRSNGVIGMLFVAVVVPLILSVMFKCFIIPIVLSFSKKKLALNSLYIPYPSRSITHTHSARVTTYCNLSPTTMHTFSNTFFFFSVFVSSLPSFFLRFVFSSHSLSHRSSSFPFWIFFLKPYRFSPHMNHTLRNQKMASKRHFQI